MSYCLYQLRFPNGKLYFGVTNDFKRRWKEHKRCRKDGLSFRLHAAIRKYGAAAVERRVLVVGPYDYIRELEITAIRHFQSANKKYGHNISPGGDLVSQETRARLSASLIARWKRPGEIERIAAKLRGRIKSPEECANISAALKGKKKSPEHTAKSAAARRGLKPTAEARQNQRLAWTQEKRAKAAEKMRAINTGRTLTSEHVEKIAAFHRGKKRGDAARANMRAGWVTRKAKGIVKKLTPAHVAKVAAWHRGKKRTGLALEHIRAGARKRRKAAP